MANRTVKDAKSIKGTNPQYLVEKIIRSRIYDSKYWKEECFALTAELLVDKAMELRFIGGVFGGNIKVTPFLCLTLKMLQIQPEKEIIVEFIKNQDFKYVRVLGAFYLRLTGSSLDCYNYLEPLLNDYRKIRVQNREGVFVMSYVDEFVDELLREERSCDIILPRMQKRTILEENNQLQPRISVLEEDDDDDDDMDMEESREMDKKSPQKSLMRPPVSKSKDEGRQRRSRSAESPSSGERRRKKEHDREKKREDRLTEHRTRKENTRGDEEHDRRGRDRSDRHRDDRKSDKYSSSSGSRDRPRERDRDHGKGRDDYPKGSRDEGGRSSHRDRDRDRGESDNRRDRGDSDRHRSSRRYDY